MIMKGRTFAMPVRRDDQQGNEDTEHEQRQQPKRPNDDARRQGNVERQNGNDRKGGMPPGLFLK